MDVDGEKTVWERVRTQGGAEGWIKQADISEDDGTPVKKIVYDRWDRFFTLIDLCKYGNYRCEKKDDFLKEFGLRLGESSRVSEAMKGHKELLLPVYYKKESEWLDSDEHTNALISKYTMVRDAIMQERTDCEFWDGLNEKLPRKCYYFNPKGFLNHLDKVAGVLEFNPYAGLTYATLIRGKRDKLLNDSAYETLTVKSNPGLCTLYDETVDDKNDYIIGSDKKKYARINGFFNADYKEYHSKYKEYRHEGIDFRGPKGRVVYSLIMGKIVSYGERPNNKGGVILIQSINKPSLYYMALHIDINSTKNEYKLKKDDFVYPGMPIAKTMDMTSAHLHVSVFRLNENVSHINKIMDSNFYLSYFNEPNWKYVINPFDYDDKNTWKGWEQ